MRIAGVSTICTGFIAGAVLATLPCLVIRHNTGFPSEHWQINLLVACCFGGCAMIWPAARHKRRLFALAYIFLLLYISASILCDMLNLAVWDLDALRSIGVILWFAGFLLLSAFMLKHKVPVKQNPLFAIELLILAGIALTFRAWFPLLSIPGALVLTHMLAKPHDSA